MQKTPTSLPRMVNQFLFASDRMQSLANETWLQAGRALLGAVALLWFDFLAD